MNLAIDYQHLAYPFELKIFSFGCDCSSADPASPRIPLLGSRLLSV